MENTAPYSYIAVIAFITALMRFLPFLLFRKHIPNFIISLGVILPPSLIAMVFIYSCKDIIYNLTYTQNIIGIYGISSIVFAFIIHTLFRNILLSIIGSTLFHVALCNYEKILESIQNL